ncbi:ABC transporter permease [Nesterenkonia sp. HG001]|uniref:ABC transporter permease n=1 Tax=Nesterenkonia sp. HG001 TaxID=2983207 RepID=UPI002AC3DD14|nr:ABC transporter permease [Nesterenkonia sp. HG001]MDZ5077668.1 ABC transporter permease [Nesterenkonia sp. HG001]
MSAPSPTLSPAPLSVGQASLLVAEREITSQVRSKAFLISQLITILFVAGGIVAMGLFGGGEDDAPEVAVVDAGQAAEALPSDGLERVEAADMAAAEELLRDGDVEAIITADAHSLVGLQVIGLDSEPADVAQLLSASPTLSTLEDESDGGLRMVVAMLFGLVFMMLSITSGMMIVQNTIQEKQSRIVEILLSSITARSLLAGKVLGNSVLAIGQAVVIAAAAAAALMLSGQQDVLDMLTVPMLWFVLFFMPGFVLIAAMFAAGAALVSRQEDSGAVITPTMMLSMIPYFVVVFFHDNSLIMTIASYVPFSAPVAMPLRMFFNEAMWFEPILALAVLLAAAVAFMLIAARVYSRSLLRTGQRVPLREALGSSR